MSKKQSRKVGVEVSHPVTAEMSENLEDDWLATASSRARARFEMNIKKLSSDERAQLNTRKWISGSAMVRSRSAKEWASPKSESCRCVGFTWKMAEDTGETKAKARLVVKGLTDPDMAEIRSESPTLTRLLRQPILQIAASGGFRLRKVDVKTAFLSGDREVARRDVCAELPQELREKLQISREQVLNLKLLYTVLDTRRGHGGNESYVIWQPLGGLRTCGISVRSSS